MSKISYIGKNFSHNTVLIIDQANDIIEEYQADGLNLTLRQLYYQFVSRAFLENTQRAYERLGTIISDARLAGLIDWEAIEDRTRSLKSNQHWYRPGQIIRAAARGFMLDHWEGQAYCPEVWIEKEALTGVIADTCGELDISYFACKGYVSQSEMWKASQRLSAYNTIERTPVIIHLGDHDPSGIDMTRDIEDRHDTFRSPINMVRIALNMNQVEQYNPPPNPAKVTDSRYKDYVSTYGQESWELDALDPRVLRDLIKKTVLKYRDEDIYNTVLDREREYLDILANIEENWEKLAK